MQILLLGGHGKVALHLTPLLLKRAWNVTSVIRNPDHESEILALGKGLKGNLNVLLSSLADVKSAADAQKIIDTVSPDYVVWSAGKKFPSPLTLSKHPTVHNIRHLHSLKHQKINTKHAHQMPNK
jgi:nucleoside-diphosphate-sugar epimerase